MADRLETLRQGLTKADKIIEIGPCHNPVTPKRDGWSAYSIDHTDRAGLLAKYAGDASVDPNLIEPVDFIWKGGSLSDAVPAEHRGTFDAFVASHVIEHTPDLVAFLCAAEALLKPDGRVVLAVPDKRVCFDYYRPVSTIGDVIDAHYQRRTRHSRKTLWDYSSHLVVKHGQPGWTRFDQTSTRFIFSFSQAAGFGERADENEYVDAHNWVFVPASFELIMLDLARLGLIDWQVERSEAAAATEFFIWLRRGGRDAAAAMTEQDFSDARHRLLETMMLELYEQSLQMPGSIAGPMAALRIELDAVKGLVVAMRATRAWQTRARLRRLLGLPPTAADR